MKTFFFKLQFLIAAYTFCYGTAYSQWKKLEGPQGGEVRHIKKNNSNIFLAARYNGIYLLKDGEWINANGNLPRKTNNYDFVQTSMGSAWVDVFSGALYHSADFEVWDSTIVSAENYEFTDIVAGDGEIYVTSLFDFRLFSSADSGRTWIEKTSPPYTGVFQWGGASDLEFFNSELYAVTETYVYKSSDQANSWDRVQLPEEIPVSSAAWPVYLASNNRSLFVASADGRVFSKEADKDFRKIYDVTLDLSVNGEKLWDLRADEDRVYFTVNDRVFYSTDNGNSWKTVVAPSRVAEVLFADDEIFISSSFNVFRGDESGNWSGFNQGLIAYPLSEVFKVGSTILTTTENGSQLLRSKDNGESWENITYPMEDLMAARPSTSNLFASSKIAGFDEHILLLTQNGIFVTEDLGDSWLETLPGWNGSDRLNASRVFVNEEIVLCTMDFDGIYLSNDQGYSFQKMEIGDTDIEFRGIAKDGEVIVYGTFDKRLFLSRDSGSTWEEREYPISNRGSRPFMEDLAFHKGVLYMSTGDGLYSTEDLGLNWSLVSEPYDWIRDILSTSNKLYFSTESDVFELEGEGALRKVSGDLDVFYVNGIFEQGDDLVLATTSGIWISSKESLEESLILSSDVRANFQLSPVVYPNPVENILHIQELMPRESVILSFFDLSGQLIWEVEELSDTQGRVTLQSMPLNSGLFVLKASSVSHQKASQLIKVYIAKD